MRSTVILLFALGLTAGCSNPHSIAITEKNKTTILQDLKDSKDFTVEEVGLIQARVIRVALADSLHQSGPPWVGQTLQQVIDDERKWRTDQKTKQDETDRLAADAKAKEDALAAQLRETIALGVFKKGYTPANFSAGDFQDRITISCAYENRSAKDIRAFTGTVRFTDLFDKLIYSSNLTITDPVKAGAKATWSGEIKYNKFEENQTRLLNTALEDMKIVWVPASIIFADGTRVGAS